MADSTFEELLTNEIIVEMASELPADAREWDTKEFPFHAIDEAQIRGLDPRYTEDMVAKALRQLASN